MSLCSVTPTASTTTKCVLRAASGVTDRSSSRETTARAPPLHLVEVRPGSHVSHEQQALQRLDVRPGRDHVDAPPRCARAKVGKRLMSPSGSWAWYVIFLANEFPFPKLLPDGSDDVLGVGVVLGEDERLGHLLDGLGTGSGARRGRPRITVRIWLGVTTLRSTAGGVGRGPRRAPPGAAPVSAGRGGSHVVALLDLPRARRPRS